MNKNLKNLRLENGESEKDVAALLNISVSEYIDKEKGIISTTNGEKKKLADFYEVDLEKFKN